MSLDYKALKEKYVKSYNGKLERDEVENLLTFDSGLMTNKFPRKRITIERVYFKGAKAIAGISSPINFDQRFGPGLWMVLADNLKGKSTLFKVIKFGLTGESGELGHEMKDWLKLIYVEFKINETTYTSYIDRQGTFLNALLYLAPIDDIIDKEIDNDKIVMRAENAKIFQSKMEDFFFKELEFYHLSWTQKASQKDKNTLNEAKATWNTYFESIYLTSRSFDKLGFGNQEELIFQMMLGLSFTYPINRLKVSSDKIAFNISTLETMSQAESKRKASELKSLEKELDKISKELAGLYVFNNSIFDVSDLFERRIDMTAALEVKIADQQTGESSVYDNKQLMEGIRNANTELTAKGRNYNDLITKATRAKLSLEEHLNFGIFFSNLDIKLCPHCNNSVSVEKKEQESTSKECQLCSHHVDQNVSIDGQHFKDKIDSINAEISGYTQQRDLLRKEYFRNKDILENKRTENVSIEKNLKEIKASNKSTIQELKLIDEQIRVAKKKDEAAGKIMELEKKKAVLEYRVSDASGSFINSTVEEIAKEKVKHELLNEALIELKQLRNIQNEEILNSFKELLLEELKDLGIVNITEIQLTESFKINYKINDSWVNFENISEGEQLRVKLAIYLSIIQLDSKFEAGKHPRILIIDSPSKEEGDRNFHNGLKKVLSSISEKYEKDVQIIIGTASRELEDAVPAENAYIYAENEYLF